jgi:hypothetical protein
VVAVFDSSVTAVSPLVPSAVPRNLYPVAVTRPVTVYCVKPALGVFAVTVPDVADVHVVNGDTDFSQVMVNGSPPPVGSPADTVAVVAPVCVATGAGEGHTGLPPIAAQPSPATH